MQQNKKSMTQTAKQRKIPERAFTKPAWWTVIFFVPITLLLIECSSMLGVQLLVLISIGPPLLLVDLFFSYFFGLAVSKAFRSKGRGLVLVFLALFLFQTACVAICYVAAMRFKGYPFMDCFDTCTKVDTIVVVRRYLLSSTLVFLPAYYIAPRYYHWMKFYKKPLKQKNGDGTRSR